MSRTKRYKTYKEIRIAQGCVIKDDKVLLIRRNEPGLPELHENFELPGGKIEKNETVEEAVVREVEEETGVRVKIDYKIPFPFEVNRTQKKIRVFIECFKCSVIDENGEARTDKKIKDFGWYGVERLVPIRIQTGSLLFMCHAFKIANVDYSKLNLRNIFNQIEFEEINPKENIYRYYYIGIKANFSGSSAFDLITYHGRINPAENSYTYPNAYECSDKDAMTKKLREKILERTGYRYKKVIKIQESTGLQYEEVEKTKRNYKILSISRNFPKLDELSLFEKLESQESKQLQLELNGINTLELKVLQNIFGKINTKGKNQNKPTSKKRIENPNQVKLPFFDENENEK